MQGPEDTKSPDSALNFVSVHIKVLDMLDANCLKNSIYRECLIIYRLDIFNMLKIN